MDSILNEYIKTAIKFKKLEKELNDKINNEDKYDYLKIFTMDDITHEDCIVMISKNPKNTNAYKFKVLLLNDNIDAFDDLMCVDTSYINLEDIIITKNFIIVVEDIGDPPCSLIIPLNIVIKDEGYTELLLDLNI